MLWTIVFERVSILVLVDLAHEYSQISSVKIILYGFNPCFSGSCSRILEAFQEYPTARCSFNPCFSGSCSRIHHCNPESIMVQNVSILVLVDLAHEFLEAVDSKGSGGFNPCFSGSCSRMSGIIKEVKDAIGFQSLF